MRNPSCFLAVLFLVFHVAAVPAEPAGADPAINRPFADSDFQRWVAIFENPQRELFAQRHEVLDRLGLKPGMAVADVGAGTGFYTLLLAEAVGAGGRVHAVDISRDFVDNILARARQSGLANVIGVVNDQESIGLPAGSLDLVFIADTYHHFERPQAMLASIRRALRPGGRLAIIDFRRQPGVASPWIMEHVRAGRDRVVKEVEAAGFELSTEPELLRRNYFLVFRKKE